MPEAPQATDRGGRSPGLDQWPRAGWDSFQIAAMGVQNRFERAIILALGATKARPMRGQHFDNPSGPGATMKTGNEPNQELGYAFLFADGGSILGCGARQMSVYSLGLFLGTEKFGQAGLGLLRVDLFF